MNAAKAYVQQCISSHKVFVFSKSYCSYSKMAKSALDARRIDYKVVEIEDRKDVDAIQDVLQQLTGSRTVPRVFVKGLCIGGGSETKQMCESGELEEMLAKD